MRFYNGQQVIAKRYKGRIYMNDILIVKNSTKRKIKKEYCILVTTSNMHDEWIPTKYLKPLKKKMNNKNS